MGQLEKYARMMCSYVSPELSRDSLPPVCDYLEMYSRGASLYPRQKTLLKIIFLELDQLTDYDHYVIDGWLESTKNGGEVTIALDIYDRMQWCIDNGYRHFYEVVNCSGRRGGKGFVGGKIAEYMSAEMISLGNPQGFYGIDESKEIHIDVLATQFSQAQGMLYNDIKDAILMDDYLSPYIYSTSNNKQLLQTPADIFREQQLKENGRKNSMRASVASIVIQPSAAQSAAIRGRASFLQCFDEFAHGLDTGSGQSSDAIYNAATPSLTQFDKDGMIYIPSSPWSQTGKFYNLYESGLAMDNGKAVEPSTFVIRAPSWEWYRDYQYDRRKKRAMVLPPEESPEMRAREIQDPETFNVEFRSNFAKTENAYLQAPVVDQIFEPWSLNGEVQNVMREGGNSFKQYVAHADAGRSQDFFAFVLGHKELGEDGYYHAVIDHYKVWQPADFPIGADGVRRIDYTVVLAYMRKILKAFYVVKFTFDQWNSGLFVDQLSKWALAGEFFNPSMTVQIDNHTSTSNWKRWERFKTTCYQGWVHAPYYEQDVMGLGHCCLLAEELKLLIVKNGNKVDHQDVGPYQHNDASDALSTVVVNLLAGQLDAYDEGTLTAIIGGAQGGYNTPAQVNDAMVSRGDAMMKQLGYY